MGLTSAFVFETTWGWAGAVLSTRGVAVFELPAPSPDDVWRRLQTKPAIANLPKHGDSPLCSLHDPMPQNATAALLVHEVRLYFEGRMQCFKTPVDLCEITPFRRLILKALRETPFGETTTYGDLATRAGRPGAARAVGGAVAANPVPLLIPCHRVLASGGGLGGFSAHGGRSLKRRLLAHEGITQ